MPRVLTSRVPGIDKLIERQMSNWEIARSQHRTGEPTVSSSVADFICLSRQVGVDGSGVASQLGEELAWPVFGREVLDAMAENDQTRRQVYESMDERDLGWWEATLRSLMQSEFGRNDYFRRLCETLLSLARQGPCVFVGRGADLVLPSDCGLRVRLAAPKEARVQRLKESTGLDEGQAEREIDRIEAERRAFFRQHFGIDSEDPLRYDMTINLARFSVEQTVSTILHARAMRSEES